MVAQFFCPPTKQRQKTKVFYFSKRGGQQLVNLLFRPFPPPIYSMVYSWLWDECGDVEPELALWSFPLTEKKMARYSNQLLFLRENLNAHWKRMASSLRWKIYHRGSCKIVGTGADGCGLTIAFWWETKKTNVKWMFQTRRLSPAKPNYWPVSPPLMAIDAHQ